MTRPGCSKGCVASWECRRPDPAGRHIRPARAHTNQEELEAGGGRAGMDAGVVLGTLYGLLAAGYVWMRGPVERLVGVQPWRRTPAQTRRDGVDFVPTGRVVLFGHHWMSIAGSSPIIAAVAGLAWGWGPVVVWMVAGVLFLGGVHDVLSLHTSVRMGGASPGKMAAELIGELLGAVTLLILFLNASVVVAVFVPLSARALASAPAAALPVLAYTPIAALFGGLVYRRKWGVPAASVLCVGLVCLGVFLGQVIPLRLAEETWFWGLLAYAACAIVLPVWVLLQPRDYLNAVMVGLVIALGAAGLFVGGPAIRLPFFAGFLGERGALWPMLFVTVSCGAASGSHALVCAGTTSRQVANERDVYPVAYGAMLGETAIALVTAMSVAALMGGAELPAALENPGGAFASALARNLGYLGVPRGFSFTLASITFVGVVVTTMDTYGRAGRYVLQELLEGTPLAHRWVASGLMICLVLLMYYTTPYLDLWTAMVSASFVMLGVSTQCFAYYQKSARRRRTAGIMVANLIYWFIVPTGLAAAAWQARNHVASGKWVAASLFLLVFIMGAVSVYYQVALMAGAGRGGSARKGRGR